MKTKKIFIPLFILLIAGLSSSAQLLDSLALSKEPEYTDLNEALKNPDKVYKLNLRKQKLTAIPKDVFKFTHLQELNLSRNKITNLPSALFKLTNLEVLDVSANKIDTLPSGIGKLVNIKKLILNQNVITQLPKTIGNLSKMYLLDLWGNYVKEFPDAILKLKNTLKVIDMRVISISEDQQEDMVKQLPNTKFFFSKSCNCG